MTDQTAEEDSESIGRRERISKLIMGGHISDAIRLIQQYFPGLLERHKNLLFMLKCRQFVEMVAGNDEFHPSSTSNALRDQNATSTDKQQQQHQRFSGYCLPTPQLCGRYRSPTNSGANDTYPTKKCNFVSPHASPKDSPRNSPHCSSNGTTAAHVIVTPSSPRKSSLPPPVIDHQLLRHKSVSPSIGSGGHNENVNGATVTTRSSDVSFLSNGCPKCSRLNSYDNIRQQKCENIKDQDVMMGVDEEKYLDDNMEKMDDDAMGTYFRRNLSKAPNSTNEKIRWSVLEIETTKSQFIGTDN
uniref:CTLH domain-containing protein n=1 Tax=Romanomermis culicivorax TaxID=13658 RepID=A0A915KPS1_ROMCU